MTSKLVTDFFVHYCQGMQKRSLIALAFYTLQLIASTN